MYCKVVFQDILYCPCYHHHNHLTSTRGAKQVLQRVVAHASFNFQYLLICLRLSSCCLHLLPSLPCSSIFPWITCFRMQFLCKIWPFQLVFLCFIVCRCSFLPWSFEIYHFSHVWSFFSILLQQHISKLSRYFRTSKVSKFQHCTDPCPRCNISLVLP